eukprot:3419089-Rhodomonas_salina.1
MDGGSQRQCGRKAMRTMLSFPCSLSLAPSLARSLAPSRARALSLSHSLTHSLTHPLPLSLSPARSLPHRSYSSRAKRKSR